MKSLYYAKDGEVRWLDKRRPTFPDIDSAIPMQVAERLLVLFEGHGDDPHFKRLTLQLRTAIMEAKAHGMDSAA